MVEDSASPVDVSIGRRRFTEDDVRSDMNRLRQTFETYLQDTERRLYIVRASGEEDLLIWVRPADAERIEAFYSGVLADREEAFKLKEARAVIQRWNRGLIHEGEVLPQILLALEGRADDKGAMP